MTSRRLLFDLRSLEAKAGNNSNECWKDFEVLIKYAEHVEGDLQGAP